MMLRVIAVLLGFAVCLPASIGHAQDASDEDRARALFEQAMPHLRDRRFVEARDLLLRAFVLDPNGATVFNLALAHWELGEATSAVALLDALLAGDHGELSRDRLRVARELRSQALADLATLVVRLDGPERAAVTVDGVEAGETTTAAPLRHPVDPGAHVVVATAHDHERFEERVQATRGEDLVVIARLVPLPTVGHTGGSETPGSDPISAPPTVDDGGGGAGWWIVAGVGVAAAVAAAIVLVLVLGGDDGQPTVDPAFGRTATLSWPP